MDQRIDWQGLGLNAVKFIAFVAGGLAMVTGCSVEASDVGEPVSTASEAVVVPPVQTTWTQGVSPAQVDTHMSNGFCYLSKIGGSFRGNSEAVWLDNPGAGWQLYGTSRQGGVTATASCIPYAALKHGDLFSEVYNSNFGTGWVSTSGTVYGSASQFCYLIGFRGETNGNSEGAALVPVANGWQLRLAHSSGTGISAKVACIARISGGISLAENTNFAPNPSDCSFGSCNSTFVIAHGAPNFCVLNSLFGRLRGGGEYASVLPYNSDSVNVSTVNLHTQQNGILASASCAYY